MPFLGRGVGLLLSLPLSLLLGGRVGGEGCWACTASKTDGMSGYAEKVVFGVEARLSLVGGGWKVWSAACGRSVSVFALSNGISLRMLTRELLRIRGLT